MGTVVEILAGGEAFEVEFSDRDGRTYESLGLRRDCFMVLHFQPISSEATSESAQRKELPDKRNSEPSLLSSLKNLGRNREEQMQKNKAALARTKARLKELEEKGDRNKNSSFSQLGLRLLHIKLRVPKTHALVNRPRAVSRAE